MKRHYRLAWPAQALQAAGHSSITIHDPGPVDGLNFVVIGGRALLLRPEELPDVLVIQRPLDHKWAGILPLLREAGVRVVIDLDDDLHSLHGSHTGFWDVHPKGSPTANFRWLERALRYASLLTVSTPALAERYGAIVEAVQVIPNFVPARYLAVERLERSERVAIGWAGTVASHPGDLQIMGNGLAQACRKTGAQFLQIGEPDNVERAVGVKPVHVPWVPISDYPTAVATFDIGVVPLAPTAFNAAKCLDASTLVSTTSGVMRIGDLVEDQTIWTRSGWRAVLAVSRETATTGIEVRTARGRSLRMTVDHRMLVNDEWKRADEIKVGDQMGLTAGGIDEVVAVEPCWLEPVDIQVDGEEFCAEGLVSHNSALKGLEYAACGVPFVASPTHQYRALAAAGVGDLASTPKEWERALRRLVTDEAYRAERAAYGRQRMLGMTIEGNVARNQGRAWLDG